MYKLKTSPSKTNITVNKSYQGETLEAKVRRMLNNKEPIKDGAPLIYTDRKEGVQPAYNIKTDRFELAIEGTDYITRSKLAQRDSKPPENTSSETSKEGGEATPTQATDNK